MLLVFHHIIRTFHGMSCCWCCYGLSIIIVSLSCVGGIFGPSCYYCYYWFVMLLVLFLVRHVANVDASVSCC